MLIIPHQQQASEQSYHRADVRRRALVFLCRKRKKAAIVAKTGAYWWWRYHLIATLKKKKCCKTRGGSLCLQFLWDEKFTKSSCVWESSQTRGVCWTTSFWQEGRMKERKEEKQEGEKELWHWAVTAGNGLTVFLVWIQ